MATSWSAWLVLGSAALWVAPALATGPARHADQSAAASSDSAGTQSNAASTGANDAITVTGCVTKSGDGYMLASAGRAPGTSSSPLTSSAAGTSATGVTPSGSVTGQTPTGSTATETATPTPAAGTSGATASPASPTYNRPSGETAGATGTVERPDAPAAASAPAYGLKAGDGVDLAGVVGRTVEVRGKLIPGADQTCCDTDSGRHKQQSSGGASMKSPAMDAPTSAARAPMLRVEHVRQIESSCRP